jgi:Fic family protein
MFLPKWSMTRDENIFYAKRNLVDSIWKEANLEGIAVTFPETQELFEGRAVAGLTIGQTNAINNLKTAWAFILDNLEAAIDLRFVRQVNGIVGSNSVFLGAGEVRNFDVSIGGTTWRPALPSPDSIAHVLSELERPQGASAIERAIKTFLAIARGQWFNDGNKRTAQFVANAILINNGAGILAVPQDELKEFNGLLIDYYQTNDPAAITEFLYKSALDGADISKQSR